MQLKRSLCGVYVSDTALSDLDAALASMDKLLAVQSHCLYERNLGLTDLAGPDDEDTGGEQFEKTMDAFEAVVADQVGRADVGHVRGLSPTLKLPSPLHPCRSKKPKSSS